MFRRHISRVAVGATGAAVAGVLLLAPACSSNTKEQIKKTGSDLSTDASSNASSLSSKASSKSSSFSSSYNSDSTSSSSGN